MSNSTNTQDNNTAVSPQFSYGGQAVIEGVMMRGSRALAVAVRNPEGDIVVHTEPLSKKIYGGGIARWPFVRGLTMLWDALGLGIKALMFSAEVALEEENEADDAAAEKEDPSKIFEGPMQWGTVAISLTFSVLLFFVFPTLAARGFVTLFNVTNYQFVENVIEGTIRLLLLIGYIWGISFMPDIKRLYRYHGAEHKTINAYEDGAELTPANVANYSLEHPRCGTAFLLSVVVISIIVYSFFPPLSLPIRILSRLVLLPLIAGIAYEFLRFTAAHQDNAFIRLITKPNLAMQHLTTAEPDESIIEVAIVAFNHMMEYEHSEVEVETAVLVEAPAGSSAA